MQSSNVQSQFIEKKLSPTAPFAVGESIAFTSIHTRDSVLDSSRTRQDFYYQQSNSLNKLYPSQIDADNRHRETQTVQVTRTYPLNSLQNSVNNFGNKAQRLEEASSSISLPLHTTQLIAYTNRSISTNSSQQHSISSMVAMKNSTNSSAESFNTGKHRL